MQHTRESGPNRFASDWRFGKKGEKEKKIIHNQPSRDA